MGDVDGKTYHIYSTCHVMSCHAKYFVKQCFEHLISLDQLKKGPKKTHESLPIMCSCFRKSSPSALAALSFMIYMTTITCV